MSSRRDFLRGLGVFGTAIIGGAAAASVPALPTPEPAKPATLPKLEEQLHESFQATKEVLDFLKPEVTAPSVFQQFSSDVRMVTDFTPANTQFFAADGTKLPMVQTCYLEFIPQMKDTGQLIVRMGLDAIMPSRHFAASVDGASTLLRWSKPNRNMDCFPEVYTAGGCRVLNLQALNNVGGTEIPIATLWGAGTLEVLPGTWERFSKAFRRCPCGYLEPSMWEPVACPVCYTSFDSLATISFPGVHCLDRILMTPGTCVATVFTQPEKDGTLRRSPLHFSPTDWLNVDALRRLWVLYTENPWLSSMRAD